MTQEERDARDAEMLLQGKTIYHPASWWPGHPGGNWACPVCGHEGPLVFSSTNSFGCEPAYWTGHIPVERGLWEGLRSGLISGIGCPDLYGLPWPR